MRAVVLGYLMSITPAVWLVWQAMCHLASRSLCAVSEPDIWWLYVLSLVAPILPIIWFGGSQRARKFFVLYSALILISGLMLDGWSLYVDLASFLPLREVLVIFGASFGSVVVTYYYSGQKRAMESFNTYVVDLVAETVALGVTLFVVMIFLRASSGFAHYFDIAIVKINEPLELFVVWVTLGVLLKLLLRWYEIRKFSR